MIVWEIDEAVKIVRLPEYWRNSLRFFDFLNLSSESGNINYE
jgi:hypothetical protein